MLENALKYASLGFKVFPTREGLKTPATTNGFKNASGEESAIKGWWSNGQKFNIAIPTGKVNGIFSLDIDCKKGKNGFLWLEQQGEIPNTVEFKTPSGGKQYIFKLPDFYVGCNSDVLADGVDIRGEVGYFVAPPSHCIKTEHYDYEGDYVRKSKYGNDILTKHFFSFV